MRFIENDTNGIFVNANMLKLESLDKSKRMDWVGSDIIVPTFVFFKDGKVVGERMVNPDHKILEEAVAAFQGE